MVDREQRNGESYADYLLRLKNELESEIARFDDYIYRLACKFADDDIPNFSAIISVFIERKRKAEKELHEVESVISSLQITVTEDDIFLARRVVSKEGEDNERT